MPTAIELAFASNRVSTDRNGRATASRRFIVDTLAKDAALTADGIPTTGSQHPNYTNLTLDRISAEVSGNGVCYVECEYSNDRRFVEARQPNRDAPSWYHWGWAQRAVQVEIPIAVRSSVISTNQFGEEITTLVWKIGKKLLTEIRIIRPCSVRITVSNVRALDVIADQTNKLHTMPDGMVYLFEGGTVSQVDDTLTYDVSYVWSRDNGTYGLPAFDTENVKYCLLNGFGVPFRPSYTVLSAIQIGNPATDIPKAFISETYDEQPDGWRLLPGTERIV
jgi:hypothetical protein